MIQPEFIEFEIGTYCNRSCSWCPNTLNARGNQKGYVSDTLWQSFMYELSAYHYSGWLALHNYNEPLLDPNVYRRIQEAKAISPQTKISIFSNGDPLNKVVLSTLIGLGIDELRVTLYPKKSKTGVLVAGGVGRFFNRIGVNATAFASQKTQRGLEYRGVIRGLPLLIIVPIIEHYTNRAGSVMFDEGYSRSEPCLLPTYSAAIDYQGNLKVCCQIQDVMNDPDYKVGNISDNGFFALWNSEKFKAIQEKLSESKFDVLNKCASCNHSKVYQQAA